VNLKKELMPEAVWADLKAGDKEGVIEEMVGRLYAAGKIPEREAVLKAIWERERKMSTGLQNGIAVPHGRTDAVAGLTAAVGIHRAGVDYGALDGKPCHIFIMTISPVSRAGPHMQFLAEVSRLVSRPEERERLLKAHTHAEVYDVLIGKKQGA
jgi:PTS system nitrogen regulatory IIA component